ncbi:nodulation efficiency protein NfeD [Edaphobacter modestus]|uniref:Nodulation efficiency protein NfeD n=2 Tax=Edaphobacter modestus TaxID=388466 RepID=A0A4V2G4D9_9BACT|nr:nodulation efficiency protein NfeD [Edaphobacter modestus]
MILVPHSAHCSNPRGSPQPLLPGQHLNPNPQRAETFSTKLQNCFAILLLLLCSFATGFAQPGPVIKLILHDTIQPISAGYLERGLAEAARRNASAVLVSLGTPGGLFNSTRVMVHAIERSPVPVIVYVSPSGSRAGSAGFFLLEAADIAAMAPGTNAGAAHPTIEGRQIDPILKEKIENDAIAFLRSFVSRRGHNAQAAEDAVRSSKSYSDEEALKLNLIDLSAADDNALLRALDGRQIRRFDGSTQTLHLRGAPFVLVAPSLRERILSRLANPDLAVLVLVLGALLIYLEFNVPGTIVPGAVGTLLVLLAFFGFNLLPIHHTAVFLLLAALILFVLEANFPSHGVLGLAGTVSLIVGLATLVDGPIPEQRVHISIAIATGLAFGGISFALAWIALRARRSKVLTGPQAMIGAVAVVCPHLADTPASSDFQVEIRGELWEARLVQPGGSFPPDGSTVLVKAIEGLVLLVEPCVSKGTG